MTSNREILRWVFENIGGDVTLDQAPSRGAYEFLQTVKASNKLTEQFYWKWMEGAWREEDAGATEIKHAEEHRRSIEEIDRILDSIQQTERTQAA